MSGTRLAADGVKLAYGERTVVEIIEELRGRYKRVAGDEVRDFLARLASKRWVELGDG